MSTTTAVRTRPILFSGRLVRAILDGKKTQTRRVLRSQPPTVEAVRAISGSDYHLFTDWNSPGAFRVAGPVWAVRKLSGVEDPKWRCPYGVPGDRLWVRENFFTDSRENRPLVIYAATANMYREQGEPVKPCTYPDTDLSGEYPTHEQSLKNITTPPTSKWWKLRPSIFMPRWASRITLELTGVRVEQLRKISGVDAVAEGIALDFPGGHHGAYDRAKTAFREGWDTLNASRGYGWDTNPFVWVLEFRRVDA